jgi:acetyl-CoA synthetase
MSETKTHAPSADFVANAKIDAAKYDAMYAESVNDPEGFWKREAQRIDWMTPFTKVKNVSYAHPDVSIKWFEDGEL